MLRLVRRSAAAGSLLLLAAAAGQAQPRSRADCEAAHAAAWGRAGKDVPWVPTFDAVVLAMLSMAQVTPVVRGEVRRFEVLERCLFLQAYGWGFDPDPDDGLLEVTT